MLRVPYKHSPGGALYGEILSAPDGEHYSHLWLKAKGLMLIRMEERRKKERA